MAIPLPGADEQNQAEAFVFDRFGTLNTKASRPAIADQEFAWIENWFPIGDGNLRTLYAEGDALYDVPNPLQDQIIFVFPFNRGDDSYKAVFLDNGRGYEVAADGTVVQISTGANQFYNAAVSTYLPHAAQWQSKFLLIVSKSDTDGYWIWNGTALFTGGTLSTEVLIVDGGSGYTSAPTVTAYGGSGSGATFSSAISGDAVSEITVVTPGSGYVMNDQPVLAVSGGGSDNGAAATATVSEAVGGVSSVSVLTGGTGHTTASVLGFSGGGGTGAEAVISGAVNGVITAVTVTNPGIDYTSAPTITVSGAGSGATFAVNVTNGQITAISVAAAGNGYDTPPEVEISGDGIGAEATATVVAGAVTAITVNRRGYGYTYAKIALVGGNRAARAVTTLMPFGVSGTSVETYQSRVWVTDVTKTLFTAPASTSDFAASSGGGLTPATDSFLRRQITRGIQANGFLYLIGDSSINVISNVQTSGVPPTTSFANSNVDPQTGSAWRDSICAFGRALVFANPSGVYALYGGAAEKVSGPLDGLFANATFNTGEPGGVTPTAGVHTIFGIRCYCLNFTTINPYTGELETLMACWDGQRWFCHTPLETPNFLSTEEIDSELTIWASDGSSLYPLFQTPSSDLEKVFQTKLRPDPSYIIYKQVNRIGVLAESISSEASPTMSIGVDTELGDGTLVENLISGPNLTFTGLGGAPISFVGTGPIIFRSLAFGLYVYGVSNYGRLIGLTATTQAQDARLISLMALYRQYAPNA